MKGEEETRKGRRGQKTHSGRVPLPVMPVTCTSRVCLPASRSGSYLHSADEVATVPRRLRVLLPESTRGVLVGSLPGPNVPGNF